MSFKKLVREKAKLIFGPKERRRNRPKRQFIDEVIRGLQESYPGRNREEIAVDGTYTIARFKDYYHSIKEYYPTHSAEELVSVLFEDFNSWINQRRVK